MCFQNGRFSLRSFTHVRITIARGSMISGGSFVRAYYAVDFGCACRRLLAMSLLFLALVVGICNGEFSNLLCNGFSLACDL